MAKSRMVNTKIWEDAWFNQLDPSEKLFFIYLLTNAMTNILGVYELSKGTMGRATGLESTVVDEILTRFEKSGKAYYRDGWVVLPNFIKHQNYRSPKIFAGIEAELQNIPNNIAELIKEPLSLYGIDTLSHSIQSNLIKSNRNVGAKVPYTAADMELSKLLLDKIRENTPTYKEPNLDKWANDCRLMREADERTEEQIRYLINWSQKNNFWQANILSMRKLREKFDTLVAQVKRDADKGKIKKSNVAF